jgi:hypothetical protein
VDSTEIANKTDSVSEIKEWQAITDYISKLPVEQNKKLPVVPVDAHTSEVSAIKRNN